MATGHTKQIHTQSVWFPTLHNDGTVCFNLKGTWLLLRTPANWKGSVLFWDQNKIIQTFCLYYLIEAHFKPPMDQEMQRNGYICDHTGDGRRSTPSVCKRCRTEKYIWHNISLPDFWLKAEIEYTETPTKALKRLHSSATLYVCKVSAMDENGIKK